MAPRPLADVVAGLRGGPRPELVLAPGATSANEVLVTDVTLDSRAVGPGSLFCCIPGAQRDGHDFAAGAVASGAAALLVERRLPLPVAQVVVDDARAATGWIAASFHGHPFDGLRSVGVTGTNGKTTTSQLIGGILRAAGWRTEVLGTLSGAHTTPEATDLQRLVRDWRDGGVEALAMEVSSHALALHRVDGASFDVGVFTNLGRDHLDFHGTEERYFAAKASLFRPALVGTAVVNLDDVHGMLLADTVDVPVRPFSRHDAHDVVVGPTSHAYTWHGERIEVGIGGDFNVMNSLAAATACLALGLAPADIASALRDAHAVPGRFEPVDAGQPFSVVVDYAHTPDGLREALSAARRAVAAAQRPGGRVIVVFGCGGDRDREKRPQMGAVAAELADHVVVTSDNPRSEDPLAIIDAAVAGVPDDYRGHVVTEPDRRSAIALALSAARPGDLVLIAGKGHETTQTIGDRVLPFDDRLVARSLLDATR